MKLIFLFLVSTLLLMNCKDDDNGSGPQAQPNEQSYLDETNPVDFMRIYYIDEGLVIEGGNTAETRGFGILFPDTQIGSVNGSYTLNTDDVTYDPETEFRAGIVYYAGDSQYAQEGEAQIELDVENEKIKIDVELNVQGEILTGHFEGNYN